MFKWKEVKSGCRNVWTGSKCRRWEGGHTEVTPHLVYSTAEIWERRRKEREGEREVDLSSPSCGLPERRGGWVCVTKMVKEDGFYFISKRSILKFGHTHSAVQQLATGQNKVINTLHFKLSLMELVYVKLSVCRTASGFQVQVLYPPQTNVIQHKWNSWCCSCWGDQPRGTVCVSAAEETSQHPSSSLKPEFTSALRQVSPTVQVSPVAQLIHGAPQARLHSSSGRHILAVCPRRTHSRLLYSHTGPCGQTDNPARCEHWVHSVGEPEEKRNIYTDSQWRRSNLSCEICWPDSVYLWTKVLQVHFKSNPLVPDEEWTISPSTHVTYNHTTHF